MILCRIDNVDRGENGIGDDGIMGNPNWRDFDVNDRSHWAYVGLSDEQFEVKKQVIADMKELYESGMGFDMIDIMGTWYYGIGLPVHAKFFKVYESGDEFDDPCNFIGYLAISDCCGCVGSTDRYDRAMVLAKDVEDWEMGRIQALLTNRILARFYKPEYVEHYFLDAEDDVERNVVPFDGVVPDAITAATDGDFVVCSVEWNAPKLSAVEKEAFDRY
jgi:hypothetical protein